MKTGVESKIFLVWGSGFGELGGTLQPRIPRNYSPSYPAVPFLFSFSPIRIFNPATRDWNLPHGHRGFNCNSFSIDFGIWGFTPLAVVSPGRTLRYEEGETTENCLILHRSSMRFHVTPTSKRQMTCDFLLFIKIQIRIFRFFTKIPKTDYWIKWSTTEVDSLYHIQNQILGYMIRSVSLLRIRKEWILPAVTRNNFNTYNLFDKKHITQKRLTSPYVLRTMLGFFWPAQPSNQKHGKLFCPNMESKNSRLKTLTCNAYRAVFTWLS